MFGCLYYTNLSADQHRLLEGALQQAVEMPFVHGNREFFFEVQSGAASEPSSVSARYLIQKANLALHAISGQDAVYEVYDDDIEADIQHNSQVEQALRHAIERDELTLYYQPQQDLQSGQLIGFEALMRWQHQGEMISPAQFIPIAESTGLIHSLGNWALRDVIKQALAWQKLSNLNVGTVAVNVSAQEFARRDYIEDIEVALADYPIDPSLIQLEITESLLIVDEQVAIERMHSLKRLGFTLAIDDFGTGYSSFSYLSRFPVDKLKIDRSFVVNMQNGQRDVALVAAMVDVAQQLGIIVIAEGVESEQERNALRELGCDQIQGYLYGKPMTAAEATLFATQAVEVL
jgi:EAL domain-containing protein (putative c-di-GMP-specific phosphodiesterase class I)